MRRSLRIVAAIASVFFLVVSVRAASTEAYVRQPHIQANRIVFCSEGDLWAVSDQGGTARRITSHPGNESMPRFSPDGSRIAFTGEYDGNRDVFVVAAEGGEPRRLTWHPDADEVVGWTPDGAKVLFRSGAEAGAREVELFSVPVDGGDPEKLPLGWATRIDIDPVTGTWAFNRSSWENATWKRYRGGTAPNIWVGHPDRADFRQVTRFDGPDSFPMWHGGRIYFLSDQGGTANLWSIRPDGSDRRRHTDFKEWDVRWPAMGRDGRIAFVLGGDAHVLNPADGSVRKIAITFPSDRILTRVRYPDPEKGLTWFDLSPDGDRLAVVTRGEIFSVPVKDGVTLPVTRGTGARESWAGFDGGGKRIVYVTDEPREEEIRTIDAWGRGEPKVVKPAGESGWHFPPAYSPDGKWIAYADQTFSLWIVPADGGTPKRVDRSSQAEIRQYVWSGDGRWIAYAKALPTDYVSIFVYDTQNGKSTPVTGPTTSNDSPAWDPDGRYLYFLSDRATNPVLDTRDFQNVEIKNVQIYVVPLKKDDRGPTAEIAGLPPEDGKKKEAEGGKATEKTKGDEKEKPKQDGKKGEKEEEEKKPKPVEIDLEGIDRRAIALPIPRGRYAGLAVTAKKVYYLSLPIKGMGESPGLFGEAPPDATLMAFDLTAKEPKPFLEGVSAYALARKADKIAVMKQRGEIYVVDAGAPPGGELGKGKVSLAGAVVELDPREEWAQIYYEGWRHMRDFYWDAGMGGVDWKAVRDRYAALLGRLSVRDDLRDLMGELIGELGTSHTYVFGGDPGGGSRPVGTGLLGADVVREGDVYRVQRIFRGDPADEVRSPLEDPGANVREGDFILEVNQRPLPAGRPFLASFQNLAGKTVVLTVNAKPTKEGSRSVAVKTLSSDDALRYADWVRRNREYVAEKTGGRIAYLHLPDMWTGGMTRFNTWFYPQLDREGMVVDVRWNGGGSVSQMILERFRRKPISFDRARGGGLATYPYRVLNGPFVVITNEFAGSDGDIFPAAVQLEGLAPVIGMRSWGGVVGIRGDKPLQDGGLLTQPEYAWWDPKQGWSLENRGVVPDIELQNLPQDLARGRDAQLDRAIEEVMRLRDRRPPLKPEFGPAKDRSRKAFESELKP